MAAMETAAHNATAEKRWNMAGLYRNLLLPLLEAIPPTGAFEAEAVPPRLQLTLIAAEDAGARHGGRRRRKGGEPVVDTLLLCRRSARQQVPQRQRIAPP